MNDPDNPKKEEFSCNTCDDRFSDSRNCLNKHGLEENSKIILNDISAEVKIDLAEKGINFSKKVYGIGKIILYECPLTVFTADTNTMLDAVFLFIHTKHLPSSGGLYEQRHWFVAALLMYYKEKEAFALFKKPKPTEAES